VSASTIHVGGAALEFVAHPLYAEAHPGEPCDPAERCTKCALARRADTGEVVLLWLVGEKHWAVSRADPSWARHRDELQAGAP
jgi:hypothetical protein